jgi:hypothetical protein
MSEILVQGRFTDAEILRDFVGAQLPFFVQRFGGARLFFRVIRQAFGTAPFATTRPCGGEASLGTFPNHIPLKFCERGKEIEHEPSLRGGRVYGIVKAFKANLFLHQAPDHGHQMIERAAQTVQFPDDHHVLRSYLL